MADESKSSKDEDIKGLDDDSEEISLKLKSQETETFSIDKNIAMMSELVKTMWEGGQ